MDKKIASVVFDKIVIDNELVANPRGDDIDIRELVNNIEAEGLITPPIVAKTATGYTLVSGFRRFAALNAIKVNDPDAFDARFGKIVANVITDYTPTDLQIINMIENLQREDLKPYQVSQGVAKLAEMGLKQKDIAGRIGKTQAYVSMMKNINTKLIDTAWAAFVAGDITVNDALELSKQPKEQQEELYGKYEEAMADDVDVDDEQVEGDRKVKKPKALASKREKKREARGEITGDRAKFAVSAKKAKEILGAIRDKGIPEKSEEYSEGVMDAMATLLGEQDWAFTVEVPEKVKKQRGRPKKDAVLIDDDVSDVVSDDDDVIDDEDDVIEDDE